MADLKQLREDVHAEVNTALPILVDQKIVSAAREFCKSSLIWQEWLDPITQVVDIDEYELEPDSCCDAEIERIIDVKIKNDQSDRLTNTRSSDFERELNGKKRNLLQLVCKPTSTKAGVINVKVALRPKRGATTIDDEVFDSWYDSIASGAKWYLMRMPNKSWSDRTLALEYRNLFYDDIRRAQAYWRKEFSQKNLKTFSRERTIHNSFVV